MKRTMQDFDQRVREIDVFFGLLEDLNAENTVLLRMTTRGPRKKSLDSDATTMLKAAAFLVIYNLVEASVRSSFSALYASIRTEVCHIEKLREEFRTIWVEYEYQRFRNQNPSQSSISRVALDLINSVLRKEVLVLSGEHLPISGNLDADCIRKVFFKHGIRLNTHYRAKGGHRLQLVKEKRNALAHGSETFVECGRQYTVEDLKRIKLETIIFLRSMLRMMDKFIQKKSYAPSA